MAAFTAGTLHYINHAIRHCICRAVVAVIDGHSRRPVDAGRISHGAQSPQRMSPLVVVLMTVEHDIHTMILKEFGNATHLPVAHGQVA